MKSKDDKVAVATVRIYQWMLTAFTVSNLAGIVLMIISTIVSVPQMFYAGILVMVISMAALVILKGFKIPVLKRIIAALEKK
jgi:hypothetical protein